MTSQLSRITLTDFRSYATLRLDPAGPLCVFTGPNGSGKTNLLEAVSMLVPGRGLRGAKVSELARRSGPGGWAVAAILGEGEQKFEIGTAAVPDNPDRRVFLLDGAPPRTQADIAAQLSAVWLTPQMDRLFTDPAGGRRRFLDRLVIALEPTHARAVAGFEAASAQRNRLLAEPAADPDWLAGLEDSMARHAVAATAARAALVTRLNAAQDSGLADPFPRVALALDCLIAARLESAPALAVEDWLRDAYAAARAADAAARAPAIGPQRTDLVMADAVTGRPAKDSSTGEQKSMLLGIILGHAALITATRGSPPLLLLDEPLVHLDESRRLALFAVLAKQRLTAWLTGTDAAPFAPFQAAVCYTVGDGRITKSCDS